MMMSVGREAHTTSPARYQLCVLSSSDRPSSIRSSSNVRPTYSLHRRVQVVYNAFLGLAKINKFIHRNDTGPIIDPLEFSSRVIEAHNGNTDALGTTGQLICMVLAAWATSFGINESGDPDMLSGHHAIRRRKERTNIMLRELLHLVDLHSLLRKPTWDGVRALLLIMPLTEGMFIFIRVGPPCD